MTLSNLAAQADRRLSRILLQFQALGEFQRASEDRYSAIQMAYRNDVNACDPGATQKHVDRITTYRADQSEYIQRALDAFDDEFDPQVRTVAQRPEDMVARGARDVANEVMR